MKTIGLIGGMSWESTAAYYQKINEMVRGKLGGLHSAKCIIYSVNFSEIENLQSRGEWEKCGEILVDIGLKLEKAGADFIIISSNTMHKLADHIQKRISLPLLHIADATADRLVEVKIESVGLLATSYTMEEDFYKSRLIARGIEVKLPCKKDRTYVNKVIFQELCLGKTLQKSKAEFLRIIDGLMVQGAQGVILGCTEIGLLIGQEDTKAPLFDTTLIHSERAVIKAIT